jgi:RNA polymerase primary sigma factor
MYSVNVYVNELEQFETLSREREIELLKLIKQGNELARDEFIKCNLKLVVKIAHDYKNMGVSLEDLISVGNIGLMKAVDKFDFNKEAKFSTYAALWIKQSMRRELSSSSRAISVCCNTLNKMKKVKALKEQNKNISLEDIAKVTNIKNKKYIANLLNGYSEVSLNQIIDDDNRELGSVIGDNTADTFEEISNKDFIDVLMKNIKNLNEREREVLRYRYGLCGSPILTQKELASKMGYTHQRIQSIEKEAIAKLRKLMKNEI